MFLAPNPLIGEDLRRRLQSSFAAHGLDADAHCVLLPPQSPISYWNLNRVADVFLDSPGWSGCNTTLEGIACGLPVVTTPGRFMRGRHSSAILTQLGVTDTIAANTDQYVEIAARLGVDRVWRQAIIDRMAARSGALYSAPEPVVALERWLRAVVSGFQAGST